MIGWNFADVYEAVAAKVPDRPCHIQASRTITWRDLDRRANALAADMIEAGLTKQSKVAAYLYNCPEYLETYVAAFKGAFAPVNTNSLRTGRNRLPVRQRECRSRRLSRLVRGVARQGARSAAGSPSLVRRGR